MCVVGSDYQETSARPPLDARAKGTLVVVAAVPVALRALFLSSHIFRQVARVRMD